MNRFTVIARYAFIASLLLLTACPGKGGGGGGGSSTGTQGCTWGSSNWNQCNWQ